MCFYGIKLLLIGIVGLSLSMLAFLKKDSEMLRGLSRKVMCFGCNCWCFGLGNDEGYLHFDSILQQTVSLLTRGSVARLILLRGY